MLEAGINRADELRAAKLHEPEGVYRIGANALRRISVKGNGRIVQRSGGPERVWRPDAPMNSMSSMAFPHSGR